jgi:hypothetical protein
MTTRRTMRAASVVALAVGIFLPVLAAAQPGTEPTRSSAKTLFFDRDYTRARAAWELLRKQSRGSEAATALYWVARCSENLKEDDRALREYGEFLALRPSDAALAEEARTSRITLATRLARAGKSQHLGIVQSGLTDSSRTVRYYAALQLSSLGPKLGRPALPILTTIVLEEKDEDLVDRAKLGILRIDPTALPEVMRKAAPARTTSGGREARSVHIRVQKPGRTRPEVSINVPLFLAELVFKSLPDEVKGDLRRDGYDADTFLSRLRKLGPSEIIDIQGDDGEVIKIWIE